MSRLSATAFTCLLIMLATAGCGEGGGESAAGDVAGVRGASDTAGADLRIDPGDPGADTTDADATDADTTDADAADAPDLPAPPFPPVIPGPPPELFDCSAKGALPGRLSPVPLSCILDPSCHDPLVVGHRGAGGQLGTVAVENSLSGIRAALAMGLDGVELDVRHTADEKLVIMHDSTVDRTTGGSGKVSELSLAEVTALKLVLPSKSKVKGDFSCDRVPSLQQALELTRDRLFVVLDTKTDRVDLVVAAIAEAGLLDQVFVSVASPERARKARAVNPAVRVQIRPDSAEELEAALLLFPERTPEVLEIPFGKVAELEPRIHDLGVTVFTDVFVTDGLAYLKRDLTLYTDLYALGADVLQTEYPQQVLRALGRWSWPDRLPP